MSQPRSSLKISAAVAAGVALVLGPEAAHAARFAAAAVRAKPGVSVAPVPLRLGAGLAAPGARASLSPLVSPSVLPRAAVAQPRLLAAAAVPALALPAASPAAAFAALAPAMSPASISPERAAARARAGAAASVRRLADRVRGELRDAGPIGSASPAAAASLGERLLGLLTGRGARAEEPAAPRATPRVSPRPLAASAAEGSEGGADHARDPQAVTKRKMIQTLDYVASIFSEQYAPLDWKGEGFGVELRALRDAARARIERAPYITTRQFQNILAEFTASLKDYHVAVAFWSTEAAMLPFSVAGAGGAYYITGVNREALPAEAFPFEPGDRIVEFDGKPIDEAVAELRRAKSENSGLTDEALAQLRLTRRMGRAGERVPRGPVRVKAIDRSGRLRSAELQWLYAPELIPEDVPVRDGGRLLDGGPDPFSADPAGSADPYADAKAAIKRLLPSALNPAAALLAKGAAPRAGDPNSIGDRDGFLPALGELIWEAPPMLPFRAYIYKNAEGKSVGYLRIPSYMGDAMAAELVGRILQKFEAETDALVLDQAGNPGGNMLFMYGLLARLTDKPLSVPKHRIVVGEEDAVQAAEVLRADPLIQTDADAMRVLGPSLAGLPVTLAIWRQLASYYRFLMSELGAGRRLTEPQAIMGIDTIAPHPTQRYTKPVITLINELDFSAGDFLPAILQDNGRGKLFGARTAGAGGAVKAAEFPNPFGIAQLAYTWTMALRADGRPIENLGVSPDIPYRLTARDLREDFAGYRAALNAAIAAEIAAAPARAEPPAPQPPSDGAAGPGPAAPPAADAPPA